MKVLLATEHFYQSFKKVFPNSEVAEPRGTEPFEWTGDLLVFTGGEDLNPMMYGQRSNGTRFFSRERDDRESHLFYQWIDGYIKAKKVLGVCRGHQFLNVINGGSLIQDLPSMGKGHEIAHPIAWHPLVNEKLQALKNVNSLHHQAISKVGSGKFSPVILGHEPITGIIESVVWSDILWGVQFHPEWLGDVYKSLFFSVVEDWVNGTPLLKNINEKDHARKKWKSSYLAQNPYIEQNRTHTINFEETDRTRGVQGIFLNAVETEVRFRGEHEPRETDEDPI